MAMTSDESELVLKLLWSRANRRILFRQAPKKWLDGLQAELLREQTRRGPS